MTEQLARAHHTAWLAQTQDQGPRMVEAEGASFDIRVPWENLHPVWRRKQAAAQQVYVDAIEGIADEETAAGIVHDVWMLQHPDAMATRPHLFRPYAQLEEAEKEKDRQIVRLLRGGYGCVHMVTCRVFGKDASDSLCVGVWFEDQAQARAARARGYSNAFVWVEEACAGLELEPPLVFRETLEGVHMTDPRVAAIVTRDPRWGVIGKPSVYFEIPPVASASE